MHFIKFVKKCENEILMMIHLESSFVTISTMVTIFAPPKNPFNPFDRPFGFFSVAIILRFFEHSKETISIMSSFVFENDYFHYII